MSAIGNDGPVPGSTESPGDLIDVIGVGSLTVGLDRVASFSSRGMTEKKLN